MQPHLPEHGPDHSPEVHAAKSTAEHLLLEARLGLLTGVSSEEGDGGPGPGGGRPQRGACSHAAEESSPSPGQNASGHEGFCTRRVPFPKLRFVFPENLAAVLLLYYKLLPLLPAAATASLVTAAFLL